MAQDTTPQTQASAPKADAAITEKQALDANGKLKAGFAFRYVMGRDASGRKVSRREFFKVGK